MAQKAHFCLRWVFFKILLVTEIKMNRTEIMKLGQKAS